MLSISKLLVLHHRPLSFIKTIHNNQQKEEEMHDNKQRRQDKSIGK